MRTEKIAIDHELQDQIDGTRSLFVVDYSGMKVAQLDALRQALRKDHAQLRVFKNTFLRRAAQRRGWPAPFGDSLQGMSGVVAGEDPVAAARCLHRFNAEHKVPTVRGGILEDRMVGPAEIGALATLPSREQLLGQFVGALAAPMAGLVGVLNAAQSQLVRVLKAIEEKKSAA